MGNIIRPVAYCDLISLRMIHHPFYILEPIGSVDDNHIMLSGETIGHDIIHCSAVFIEQDAILRLTVPNPGNIIG